ncbi:MAG TPA: DUF433 domain-containing protein [Candidatus Tectomicrobia bacterium]|jgi:uncharacterized protein (DUF433 family)
MRSVTHYPHISIDEKGTAHIGQTRYKVIHLAAEHYHYGWSAEELLRQHPDLRPEEVYAALTYFYDHHDTLVNRMRADTAYATRGARTKRCHERNCWRNTKGRRKWRFVSTWTSTYQRRSQQGYVAATSTY